jgi:hypothetical protein
LNFRISGANELELNLQLNDLNENSWSTLTSLESKVVPVLLSGGRPKVQIIEKKRNG